MYIFEKEIKHLYAENPNLPYVLGIGLAALFVIFILIASSRGKKKTNEQTSNNPTPIPNLPLEEVLNSVKEAKTYTEQYLEELSVKIKKKNEELRSKAIDIETKQERLIELEEKAEKFKLLPEELVDAYNEGQLPFLKTKFKRKMRLRFWKGVLYSFFVLTIVYLALTYYFIYTGKLQFTF